MRYVHANGASMFFLAVYIHIFRGLYYGSYKEPREVLWILGVIIFLLMMATAFMGYVLPWGQMSFWAATVITNLFSAIPLVGDDDRRPGCGAASAVDKPTLNRFFSLHYLLPFVIVGVVVLHIWALHVSGQNNPDRHRREDGRRTRCRSHPTATVKDSFGIIVLLHPVRLVRLLHRRTISATPDNYIPANPLQTPPHIVPEWYFLPFYAILRAIPSKLGGVVAMFGRSRCSCSCPGSTRSKVRSARYRPLYKQFFWILLLVVHRPRLSRLPSRRKAFT